MTTAAPLIAAAADMIRRHNPRLADCWQNQAARRVDIACAFSRGFVADEAADPPAFCLWILRLALADRAARAPAS